jgi:hypothetical protein
MIRHLHSILNADDNVHHTNDCNPSCFVSNSFAFQLDILGQLPIKKMKNIFPIRVFMNHTFSCFLNSLFFGIKKEDEDKFLATQIYGALRL